MKKTEKTYTNKNGYEVTIQTVETNVSDGFVKESEIHPIFTEDDIGKSHLGYQKHIFYTTDDFRVTRIAIALFSLFFLFVGFIFYKYAKGMEWIMWIVGPFVILFFIVGQLSITKYQKEKKQKGMNNKKED